MGRREERIARWQAQARAAREALEQWRQQHPAATFTEIEDAVDQQVDALRAQVVEDLALACRAADLPDRQAGAPPRCPTCGERLASKGQPHRRVLVRGGQAVNLHRKYRGVPGLPDRAFPPG